MIQGMGLTVGQTWLFHSGINLPDSITFPGKWEPRVVRLIR